MGKNCCAMNRVSFSVRILEYRRRGDVRECPRRPPDCRKAEALARGRPRPRQSASLQSSAGTAPGSWSAKLVPRARPGRFAPGPEADGFRRLRPRTETGVRSLSSPLEQFAVRDGMEIGLGSVSSLHGPVFVRDGCGNGSPRNTQVQKKIGPFAPAQTLVSVESADPEDRHVFRTRRTPIHRESFS
jgi:hypothetical protein